ncbi:hypothetical protein, partial [Burkholderia cepacia]|uniref:hypothetical protein n=1 Tax=Burkholderia cepacia TaxID=292 RepID=UPI001590A41D
IATAGDCVVAAVRAIGHDEGTGSRANYVTTTVHSDAIPRVDAQVIVIAVNIRLRVAIDPYTGVLAICSGSAGCDATSVNGVEAAACVPHNQIGATRRINYIPAAIHAKAITRSLVDFIISTINIGLCVASQRDSTYRRPVGLISSAVNGIEASVCIAQSD